MSLAERRINRFVLTLEVALGVLPITIVGGFYALLGGLFGTVSLMLSLAHLSLSVWWLSVFALAIGGLTGITGLWLLVAMAMTGTNRKMQTTAFVSSTIGVITAIVALVLAEQAPVVHRWAVVYLLVSPIVVVCHHTYARFA